MRKSCIRFFLGSHSIFHTVYLIILAKSKTLHRQCMSMKSKHSEQITGLGKLCKGGQTLKMT